MSSLYEDLMKKAQKEKIALANENSLLLRRIYEEASRDLLKKANTSSGGFTKAWLSDYEKYLEFRYNKLNEDISKLVEDSILSSAQIAATVEKDFISYINNKYKLDISEELLNDMLGVNQDVVLRMLSGSYYKNNSGVSNLIWGYSDIQKNDVNYIIAKGMIEQKPYKDLIKDLEKYVDPKKRKDFDFKKVYPKASGKYSTVDFNAQRLLRTSINHTFFNQMMSDANKNPYVNAIHWNLSAVHFDRQVNVFGEDICDEYASQDRYNLGIGNFPKDNVPMPHPCCMCFQYPVNAKSLEDIAGDLKKWVNGESMPKLDKWFKDV